MESQYAIFPHIFHLIAIVSLAIAFACALVIVVDELLRPQKMWIMNLVWPLTTLFGSCLWLVAYLMWGRQPKSRVSSHDKKPAFPVMVFKGSTHCGAGCTLGDIVVEWLAFTFPAIPVWFGWRTWFTEKTVT